MHDRVSVPADTRGFFAAAARACRSCRAPSCHRAPPASGTASNALSRSDRTRSASGRSTSARACRPRSTPGIAPPTSVSFLRRELGRIRIREDDRRRLADVRHRERRRGRSRPARAPGRRPAPFECVTAVRWLRGVRRRGSPSPDVRARIGAVPADRDEAFAAAVEIDARRVVRHEVRIAATLRRRDERRRAAGRRHPDDLRAAHEARPDSRDGCAGLRTATRRLPSGDHAGCASQRVARRELHRLPA